MVAAELAARHDLGALAVSRLARRTTAPEGAAFTTHKARARVCELRLGTGAGGRPGPRAVLAVPLTYMNESGGPVANLLKYFSVDLDQLVVVHDELDIPSGSVRVKRGGGEGGHNGLRSMSKSLSTKDYLRVRFGIGRPPGRQDPADYVLSDFSAAERKELDYLIDRAADAVESLIVKGLEPTQNAYHAA
jgi:peptidyl-tRNA hydrolase, PTH1 family